MLSFYTEASELVSKMAFAVLPHIRKNSDILFIDYQTKSTPLLEVVKS